MESASIRAHESTIENGGQQPVGAAQVQGGWTPADPGPLGLAAFALTTFVLSMFNAGLVSKAGEPVVLGLALAYGGIAQILAGMWEFRTGNTFGAVAFTSFGAFWISFWAFVTFFAGEVPAAHVGAAVGLYLIAWGIFTTYMFVASLRTNAAVALVFFLLAITFFLLGIGNSGGNEGMVEAGGWFGLGDGGGGLVCIVCGGRQFDLRADGAAGPAIGSLSRRGAADGNCARGRRDLERQLERMLEIESFEPPAEFRERALWSDPAIYEEAAADPEAWWLEQAKELLDWDAEPSEALDDSNPPFYKWFEDGRLNASANCLDRHVEAGRGDRVAYHWRGEEGEERDVTYAELHRDVQRFANALKDLGVEKGDVVGIYLPMIPEVVVAMLACARIGALHNVVFGGFSAESVRERMEFSEAKALITVDGARRKGKTAPIKASGRRADGRPREPGDDRRRPPHRDRLPDERGPRRLLRRG